MDRPYISRLVYGLVSDYVVLVVHSFLDMASSSSDRTTPSNTRVEMTKTKEVSVVKRTSVHLKYQDMYKDLVYITV